MKITSTIFLTLLFALRVYAELPAFEVAPFKVTLIPSTEPKRDYRPDPEHTKDGKIVYELTGQVFAADAGKISPATKPTAKATPWETLSDLLAANKAKDIEAIRALYDSSTQMDKILDDPAMKAKWEKMAEKITDGTVQFAFNDGDKLIAFVKMGDHVQPLGFVKVGQQYRLASKLGGSQPSLTNIMLALANFGIPYTEIVSK